MSLPVQQGLAHDVIDTRPSKLVIPAKLKQLADSLGMNAKELSKRIPEDTLRRLLGASANTLEHVTPEGRTQFERNVVAGHDTLISTTRSDHAHGAIPRGSGGFGSNAEENASPIVSGPYRDSSGRFTARRGA